MNLDADIRGFQLQTFLTRPKWALLVLGLSAAGCSVNPPVVPNPPQPPSPIPATTTAPATADHPHYYRDLNDRIGSLLIYPPRALHLRERGSCRIRLEILRDGTLVQETLIESSGIPELDDECNAVARRAAPFPAFPESTDPKVQRVSVEIPVNFVP